MKLETDIQLLLDMVQDQTDRLTTLNTQMNPHLLHLTYNYFSDDSGIIYLDQKDLPNPNWVSH